MLSVTHVGPQTTDQYPITIHDLLFRGTNNVCFPITNVNTITYRPISCPKLVGQSGTRIGDFRFWIQNQKPKTPDQSPHFFGVSLI
jgi:hypothetical protein